MSPSANILHGSSVQIPAADSMCTVPDTLILPPITPPQSSKDTSLPLKSSEDVDGSNVRGQRRSRRTRTLIVSVDGLEVHRKH